MRTVPLLAAVLLACAPAAAQHAVLRPGSAEVAAGSIPAGTEMFEVSALTRGTWTPVAQMTLRTTRVTLDGRDAVVRTEQTWIHDELAQVDSFVLDPRTLAPVRVRSAGMESGRSMDFRDGGVRTIEDGDWGADTAEVDLPEPVFAAGLTDLMLAALPLAEGYSARLAVWDMEEGAAVVWATVEGAEELAVPSGARVPVWRVRVADDATGGTYWLDRESRALVQYENGPGTVRARRAAPGAGRSRPTR